ncbi:MAG TPA: TonB-dependent receptor plug domain-containing protein [Flavobacteriales bacterium]|nr:TonB-dependent receptor plug domain-containing protein [Flavobacteriales bacterium]
MKKLISYTIFVWLPAILQAQKAPDTTRAPELKTVEIVYFDHTNGIKEVIIPREAFIYAQGKSIADILQKDGHVYVKQYGPGQLSTITMRGGNASQTQLLWKGFNLNNLSVGQTDFSLVPASVFNSVTLEMGAAGATGGNGVVSGGITLNNAHEIFEGEKWSLAAAANTGSFGRYAGNLSYNHKFNKTLISFKPYYSAIKNNFPYTDFDGNKKTMDHASVLNYGALGSIEFYLKKHHFSLDAWAQSTYREMPLAIVEAANVQTQDDKSLKIALNHARTSRGLFYKNRLGYFYDQLDFVQSPLTTSGYNTHNFLAETVSSWKIEGFSHSIAVNGSLAFSENTGYEQGIKKLFRSSLGYFAELSRPNKKLIRLSFALKQELNDKNLSIPILQTGVEGHLLRLKQYRRFGHQQTTFINYKINAGTVYRFPTLNDRYWLPGGNPELKPEKGYTANAGLVLKQNIGKNYNFIKVGFTHYERYVYDWIMWQPRNGYWTPQNLLAVWSRGNETTVHIELGKKIKYLSKWLFNYTVSTLQKSNIVNDNSIGRQLIYTPMYNVNGEAGIKLGAFSFSATFAYYGYRYTSSDNYEYLEPFHLFGARAMYAVGNPKINLNVYAEVDNIANVNYYWVAQRPALPRNFNVGLIIKTTKLRK